MIKVFKGIYKVIQTIICVILAVLLIFNVFNILSYKILKKDNVSFFGYSTAVVVTGSMAKTININDLVVVKSFEDYNINDIIMFRKNANFVTHRIVDETEEGFITKGDANNAEDEWIVKQNEIVGKSITVIPKVGFVLDFFKTPTGLISILLIGFLLIEGPLLIEDIKKKRKEEKEEEMNGELQEE